MMEYNKLTKRLLDEGYTTENYPSYVQIDSSRLPGDDPLNNLSGGFEYKRWYADQIVYRTGCGKFVMGSNVIDSVGYMGVEWQHENDNPVIRCPYDKPDCQDNDSRLHGMRGGGLCIQCWCVCHRTEDSYDYENSIEKANKERREERDRKYQEYADARNGRVCQNHMYYDERTREWNLHYEPKRCTYICYARDGYCPILGKKLSKKRGNVYYDVKTSGVHRRTGDQCSLLDGTQWTNIRKAVRFFAKPCSMDICEAFIKVQSGDIERYYRENHSVERMMDPSWRFEILNIRAESKPSRDLTQDLEDIKAGIYTTFDPESEKQAVQRKKEKRAAAKQKSLQRLEKKILEVGYENLEEHSIDKTHADKWLSAERIMELERIRKQRIREEQCKPVQMTLEDIQTENERSDSDVSVNLFS